MNSLPRDARSCGCGHSFDHDDNDAALTSEEIRIKAEELYESYLAARVDQAAQSLANARSDYARDATNSQKSQRVADAIHELDEARSAHSEQSARVQELRRALPPKSTPLPQPVVAVSTPNIVVPAAAVMRPAATMHRVTMKSVSAQARVLRSMAIQINHEQRVIRRAHAAPRPVSRPEPTPPQPEIHPPAAPSKMPNKIFRKTQAEKAEKIMRTANARTQTADTGLIIAPRPKSPAPDMPVESKKNTTQHRLPVGDTTKECPNCTASVSHHQPRCRCGYEFPTSESLIPALHISDEERAELAKLFLFP